MQNLEDTRLKKLLERRAGVVRQIAAAKRKLRDQSRRRTWIRDRLIGQAVLILQGEGKIPASVTALIIGSLLDLAEGHNRHFEALQGCPFDPTDLLHETSQAVE